VLLVTDDPKTATGSDPQALIEEARQRQRQRARRRKVALGITGLLVIFGFGINQLVRGGGSVHAAAPAAASVGSAATITYEKIVVRKIVPHLPVEKKTIETWSASSSPSTNRQVVTIAGGPRLEIGAAPAHGKVLGSEQANYLYDASTNTIYRTGFFVPPQAPPPRGQTFKRLLAEPGVRLAGTRTYRGRSVYVIDLRGSPGIKIRMYVDKRTYEPMMYDETGPDLRVISQTVAFKVLRATKANVALTSLPTAHPHAHTVLHASPRIRSLYGEAAFPSGDYG
jgi:hypothetical protein